MKIYQSFTELVGATPLLELKNYGKVHKLQARVLGKLECFNPAGSVKDRVALKMIEDAEEKGVLKAGGTIIEPTSGNTGIGLAAVASGRGYGVILTMPESMSQERRTILKAYGATLVLTPASLGMQGAIDKAQELGDHTPNSVIMGQFENQANARAHYETTGPEIWEDTQGVVDIFIAGVGTGGTVTGVGRYLKEKNPNIQIIAVEPKDSPMLTEGRFGPHGIQGIGANFIPQLLDQKIYDRVITVSSEDAFQGSRDLARTEGIMVGISSGAALWVASEFAKQPENKGKTIVALLPDTGDRYLSTKLFETEDL